MNITEKFIPLGPEMAFKMPDGEFLPMWAADNVSDDPCVIGITRFDGDMCRTTNGAPWRYCMPMEGHPIPESALLKKPDRLMTWREAAVLLGRYRWGEWVGDHGGSCFLFVSKDDWELEFNHKIRKWGSDELVEPMFSLLEAARKEAAQ